MFNGSQNIPFHPIEDIFQRYNQEWLYLKYTGIYPEINKRYNSLFRQDRTPGCRFEWRSGVLYFVDNAGYNGQIYFDIIHTIRILHNVDVKTAIHMIRTENVPNYEKPIGFTKERHLPEIKFKYIKWPEDNYFGIEPHNLHNENVYLVSDYWIKENGVWLHNNVHNPRDTLTIGYYFPDTNHTKLYWPFQQNFKWYSNCIDDVFGESKLDYYLEKDKRLIVITKSQKDRLILDYKCDIASIAPQTETSNINKEIIYKCKKFDRCVILYDNDVTGQKYAAKLSEKTGFSWVCYEMGKDTFDNKNNIEYIKSTIYES